jgi:hypothetical protein
MCKGYIDSTVYDALHKAEHACFSSIPFYSTKQYKDLGVWCSIKKRSVLIIEILNGKVPLKKSRNLLLKFTGFVRNLSESTYDKTI